MSGAFNPWTELAKIRRERLGGLGADEVPAAAGEARFSARLAGLGGLGIRRPAASDSDPAPVTKRGPLPHGGYDDAEAVAELARELLRLADAGAAALAEPDPALDEERTVMAGHYAAEPSDRPYLPGDPDPLRDGLLIATLMRPPFWDGGAPPRGA